MPTVIDTLRRLILGDEAADRLQLVADIWLTRSWAKISSDKYPTTQSKATTGSKSSQVDLLVERFKPSLGYEPLLMKMGWDQPAARAIAKFAVNEAKQQARESKACRQAVKDIKFLAQGGRQKAAMIRRTGRLYGIWEANNRSVGDLLYRANIEDFRFMILVKSVANGGEEDVNVLVEMAAEAAPRLSLKRGPKITAPSAAHQFFLEDRLEVMRAALPGPGPQRRAEYVDALTQATRAEFNNSDFDTRPARERAAAKGLIKLGK